MSSFKNILGIVVALVAFIAYSSYFVVDERQKALVLRFGEINRSVEKPGLYFKVPFADTCHPDRRPHHHLGKQRPPGAGHRQPGLHR